MIIHHFSDTHTFHNQLIVPEKVDLMIFSGDCSNTKDYVTNFDEVIDFIRWYAIINCPNKIFCAGNHDGSIASKLITRKTFEDHGIIYLENESIKIEGLKIWGSPISPSFGGWSFMKSREKLHDLWQTIPEDTDIVITHGPPKGVLDLSENREGRLEMCGCNALVKRLMVVQPKLALSGHIHSTSTIVNTGIRKYDKIQTIFSNASCVTDGQFSKGLTSHGNIIEI